MPGVRGGHEGARPETRVRGGEDADDGPATGYGVERAPEIPEDEDDEAGPRARRRREKREAEGKARPRSERAEVMEVARSAERQARARARRDAAWKARIRRAYVTGALLMIPAGITAAVLGGRGPDATTWIIVGSVVSLCGLVAILGLLGILPDQ